MFLWMFWYTFDDWLAAATGIPLLGTVPLILAIVAEWLFYVALAILSGWIALPLRMLRGGRHD